MGTEVNGTPDTLGERNLTTLHAIGQSLALGPMFSVGIVLGSVSAGSGWNATLSVLIAGLGVLAIGYAVTVFARRYSGAGAVYEYLTHGAHPALGIYAAGVFFIGSLFLGGGGIFLGLGILSNGFWTAHIADSAPAWWVFALIFLAITLVLNYIGVRIAIGAMLTLSAISFIPMLLLGVVMVVKGGADGNTLSRSSTRARHRSRPRSTACCSRSCSSSASRLRRRSARRAATRSGRFRVPCSAPSRHPRRSSSSWPTRSRSASDARRSRRAHGPIRPCSTSSRRTTSARGSRRSSTSSSSSTPSGSRSRSA